MNKNKTPASGTVTIGTKPLWELMVEEEVARRARWDKLRADGWFSIFDVMKKTGWSKPTALRWCENLNTESENLYNPETARTTRLYAPRPVKRLK